MPFYSNVAAGDTILASHPNKLFQDISDTTSGHHHDGIDSKAIIIPSSTYSTLPHTDTTVDYFNIPDSGNGIWYTGIDAANLAKAIVFVSSWGNGTGTGMNAFILAIGMANPSFATYIIRVNYGWSGFTFSSNSLSLTLRVYT